MLRALAANVTVADDETTAGIKPLHLLGLAFAALSSLCSTTGILIQKYSAHVEAGRSLCRRWRFWVGFTINTGSEAVLSTVALYFTPLSLIAPLGGLSVIFNALLTRFGIVCGIKEVMTVQGWIATVIVLMGVTLVSLSGPGSNDDGGPIEIAALPAQMQKPLFVVLTTMAAAVVLGWIAVRKVPALKPIRPSFMSLTASVFSGVTAACCGAYSVMFLKIVSVGVPAWISEPSVIPHPLFFVAVLVVATVAPLQLWLLNLSLAAGKATFAVPLYISLLMVFMSVFGGILFDEFVALLRPPLPLYIVLYVTGVVLVIAGLFRLSTQSRGEKEASQVAPLSGSGGIENQMVCAAPDPASTRNENCNKPVQKLAVSAGSPAGSDSAYGA